MSEEAEWVKVCNEKSLKNGDMLDFDQGSKKILVAKIGGNVYATDRICTHAYADLSTGIMNEEEKTVTCPLHLSAFKFDKGNDAKRCTKCRKDKTGLSDPQAYR